MVLNEYLTLSLMATRDRWNSRAAFLFAAIGSAVGLGNVWRFPFIAHANGGGAFLIPYFVALLTAGIPLLIVEFGLGQFFQTAAPEAIAKIKKKFEWVGWFAILVAAGIVTYYMAVMAWSFRYLYASFSVPWAGNEADFFFKDVLNMGTDPGMLGGIVWPLLIGLFISWLLVYIIIKKGVGRVGKVVMWTVPIPLVLLLILLIRGLTLPGAWDGVIYYLTADFSVLSDPNVWLAAYGQIFFSLSIGAGMMIAYASFLPKKSDINNNAMMTSLTNCGTSFFAGFAVFSIIGYLAASQGVATADVITGGPGLAFITFPTALAQLPFAPFFAVVFFLSLLLLGIDSAMALTEAIVAALRDRFENVSRNTLTLIVCSVCFLIGLIYITQPGIIWLDIVDHWMNNYGLVFVGLMMCILIGYYYGAEKFMKDTNAVSDIRIGTWWVWSIKYITPLILIWSLVQTTINAYVAPYEGYPLWALNVGGWGLIGVFLVSSMLLMKDKSKWSNLLKLIFFLVVIVLVAMGHTAMAMFVFGSVMLYGGLIWAISKAQRTKNLEDFQ
jgi:NSS family neurotransmitter:Na+ symporter